MLFVVWVPLVSQLIIPLALLAWLALGQPSSRAGWLARVVLVGSYIAAIGAGGLWLVAPWYLPFGYAALWLIGTARSHRNAQAMPWSRKGRRAVAGVVVVATAAVATVAATVYVMMGWRTPIDAVDLQFPMRGGPYLVVNGGGNALINPHLKTLTGDRFRPWRGQSYGVDIVKLDRLGMRVAGILPSNPTRYEIFGEPVYAPCTGDVVAAVDGVAEMRPPAMDRENMSGNHILIDCDGVWVELAHLQRGSVVVQRRERVEVGQWLARVGNTGNTNEPHLHIHAQRPATDAAPMSGDPLPIRFGERYPVRNMRISLRRGGAAEAR